MFVAGGEQGFLEKTFGLRVSFDRVERMLYSHDVGEIPYLIKPLIGKTVPQAVVQPNSEGELLSLVKWARETGVPITPRAKATSGYGGVIPVKEALVVDFIRMREILAIDEKALTARVQPGIGWEPLDKALAKKGLTLRLYPTSYPSSTVGGWAAQGGAGIGSFESGWFRDNIVSIRTVLADGTVREFKGADIDLVYETGGTMGLISEITIKVMKKSDLVIVAASSLQASSIQKLSEAVIRDGLPIWSMLFINPKMAELKNKTPHPEHDVHEGEYIKIPEAYVVTIAYRAEDATRVASKLAALVAGAGMKLLPDDIAAHEWDNRFKVMQVKRLGPSLVPAEVVVPLEHLEEFLDDMDRTIHQPVVKEGMLVKNGRDGRPEVVILGFIPADQRKFNYHFVFSLSLSIMKVAERHGGRAYATGLYFSGKAESVFGAERLAKLRVFKKQVDPRGLMNPKKILEGNVVSSIITLVSKFEPITRFFGNQVLVNVGERITGPKKGIPADVAWHAYGCSQCGYCVDTCDQFYGRLWESQTPRGKWYWLRMFMEGKVKWDQKVVDTFMVCTTCERCSFRCPEGLPVEASWMKLRGKLINDDKRMTFPPFEMMAAAMHAEGNIWAGFRKDRAEWFPKKHEAKHGPDKKTKSEYVYFAGCTVSYVENDIGIAAVELLDKAGIDFTYLGKDENCCGTPMLAAGKWDTFKMTMKHNLEAIKKTGAKKVITSCPACDMMWRHAYPTWAKKLGLDYDIECFNYTEVLGKAAKEGTLKIPARPGEKETVTFHDSCHLGRVSGIYEPPRDLIKAIPNVEFKEMESNREDSKCCGSVLTLIKEPDVAAVIGKDRLDEAIDIGAKKVLAICPCCQFQLRCSVNAKNLPIEVVDLGHYVAESFGLEMPDPNPEVRKNWAVFEAMIALMTPKGFADLMATMFPELMGAMPLGMGSMMKFMGRRMPFMLSVMKPMFPILFPILLPGMMPKVMDTMLARVGDAIPMPEHMKAQMPDLMPKVMDNLMPHMIGDVVPLVTPPMIAWLKSAEAKEKVRV
jgi:Fe-S oxidoreductase/FAD/FMN-containing dehydrogenase